MKTILYIDVYNNIYYDLYIVVMYGILPHSVQIYILHGMAGDHWMLYNRSVTNLNHQLFILPMYCIIIITNDHVRHNMWWVLCSINRQLVFACS